MDLSNYSFQSELGRGGMATVFLAHDNKFDTNVAVKVLSKEFVHNENIRKRFLAEAKNMFKMSHPNIIKVTDLIDEGDTVAFVMEYIEGETLKEYIDRKGKLSDEEIKNLFSQMLDAVGYVHDQNLVHRDIKPSNFMLDKKGIIKLMDFGIAKNMDITSSDYTHTGTNQNMGTPMYMSPEQIKSTKDVTLQSDIYSLGVVLWQMATGNKPYDLKTLSTFELQTKVVTEKLPLVSSIFNEIIQIATDKELNNRFKNCKEFKNKLSNVQNQNFDKTLIYVDNNSEKTTVIANIDSTVVESVQNSNTIPKPQINIPYNQTKQTKSSPPVAFIILGIIIIIVLGVIISNNNSSYTPDSYDYTIDTLAVEAPYEDVVADSTALPDYFYCNDGKEIPYSYVMDGECDCPSCEDE